MTSEHPRIEHMQAELAGATGVATVTVTGEIDLASADELRHAIDQAMTLEVDRVVVPLPAVSFCDSSGIRVLAVAERDVTLTGVSFRIAGAGRAVRKVFAIAGLDQLLDEAKSD